MHEQSSLKASFKYMLYEYMIIWLFIMIYQKNDVINCLVRIFCCCEYWLPTYLLQWRSLNCYIAYFSDLLNRLFGFPCASAHISAFECGGGGGGKVWEMRIPRNAGNPVAFRITDSPSKILGTNNNNDILWILESEAYVARLVTNSIRPSHPRSISCSSVKIFNNFFAHLIDLFAQIATSPRHSR